MFFVEPPTNRIFIMEADTVVLDHEWRAFSDHPQATVHLKVVDGEVEYSRQDGGNDEELLAKGVQIKLGGRVFLRSRDQSATIKVDVF